MIEVGEGVFARIFHERFFRGAPGLYTKPSARLRGLYPKHAIEPRGGLTIAVLCDEQGVPIETSLGPIFGDAVCSQADNYCRATGRLIAIGRAKKALEKARELTRAQAEAVSARRTTMTELIRT